MIEYFKRYWFLIVTNLVVWGVTIYMVRNDHFTKDENETKDSVVYQKPNVDSLIKVKDSVISKVEHIKEEQSKNVSEVEKQKETIEKIKKEKDIEIRHIREIHKKDTIVFKENEKLKQELRESKRKEREYFIKQRDLNDSLIFLKSSMN